MQAADSATLLLHAVEALRAALPPEQAPVDAIDPKNIDRNVVVAALAALHAALVANEALHSIQLEVLFRQLVHAKVYAEPTPKPRRAKKRHERNAPAMRTGYEKL